MNRIARMRPTPAMVVALIALFVSLSGVTWAALELPRDSITSKYLKDGKAVKNQDVVNDTLQGNKIAESTLGQVPSANRATSAGTADNATTAGSASTATTASNAELFDDLNSTDFLRSNAKAADAELLDGRNSTAFLSSTLTIREGATFMVNNNSINSGEANCNPGEKVIAGGPIWSTTPISNQMPTLESVPTTNFASWNVTMGNTSGSTKSFSVRAICVGG